jgi:site-specific DNA-methyltransferase (adenine-specific)
VSTTSKLKANFLVTASAYCLISFIKVAISGEQTSLRRDWLITSLPKGVVVWDKTAGSRPVKGGFNLQTEFILWGRKGSGAPELYAQGVVTAATLTKKQHITQKPVKVIKHLLKVVPKGGKVLDPFAGVGTTGVAAVKNGYSFTGVEVVPEYFEIGCRRLKEIEGN